MNLGPGGSEARRLLLVVRGEGNARIPMKILAHQLGVTEQRVGQLLAGSPPSLALAARIFRVFGIAAHLWAEPVKAALSTPALPNADADCKVVA
jgi:hypothetical protein